MSNFKSKRDLVDEIVKEFHQLPKSVQQDVFKHKQHHNFDEWYDKLLESLDDLIEYYARKNYSIELIHRLNNPNIVVLPSSIKGVIEQYQDD